MSTKETLTMIGTSEKSLHKSKYLHTKCCTLKPTLRQAMKVIQFLTLTSSKDYDIAPIHHAIRAKVRILLNLFSRIK